MRVIGLAILYGSTMVGKAANALLGFVASITFILALSIIPTLWTLGLVSAAVSLMRGADPEEPDSLTLAIGWVLTLLVFGGCVTLGVRILQKDVSELRPQFTGFQDWRQQRREREYLRSFEQSESIWLRRRWWYRRFHRPLMSYPDDWDDLRHEVYARDGYRCVNCGATNVELHAHHIVPLSVGGTNRVRNLATVCFDCHARIHPHMRR